MVIFFTFPTFAKENITIALTTDLLVYSRFVLRVNMGCHWPNTYNIGIIKNEETDSHLYK